jgi:ABC-type multidrug transport system ATPase subunit
VALLGENGAGKTTFLRCMAGLVEPTSGQLLWFGESPRRKPALRRRIGMVAHQNWLYGELTARENLWFAARMYGLAYPSRRIEELLAEAELQPYAHRRVAELSQGLRQRLSICRSIIHEPQVLLLDEPFSCLDDRGRGWLMQTLRQLRTRSTAICLTCHDFRLAQCLADSTLRLQKGRLHGESIAASHVPAAPGHWEVAA